MEVLDLARWQFGITTVYHYLFVPLTLGLSVLVAVLQTAWYRTGRPEYLRLTKLFGKLFLINFALGVATGIVQEFQFGMSWSDYSRFVGDVFGAPLAIEALLAFFLESTFLGLWIFGWERLPRRVHLACIWVVAVGSQLSAIFILAANSWMQHPVGVTVDAERGRAELTDFVAVLTNKVLLVTYPHTIAAAFMVAGAFMAGIGLWYLVRRRGVDEPAGRIALRLGAATLVLAGAVTAISGDLQGKVMTDVQPMKMAAAEALYESQQPASFSVFTIGTLDGQEEIWSLRIPGLLSYLGEGSFDAEVVGMDELQAAYEEKYGPGTYTPNIPVTYWTFRLMIGTGMTAAAIGAWLLWVTRRGRPLPRGRLERLYVPVAVALPLLPLAGNAFGWIFTEMGRQPWLVFGLLPTASGVSPGVSVAEVATSLSVFTVLYGALAVVEVRLLLKTIRGGIPDEQPPRDPSDLDPDDEDADDVPLVFSY